MSVEPHNEPTPQDYLEWEAEIPEEMQAEIASSRWTSRSILGGMAVCCLVLALGCYAGAKTWLDGFAPSAVSSPTGTVSQSVESELARSLREIESLKKAVSDQNATNEQMVIATTAFASGAGGIAAANSHEACREAKVSFDNRLDQSAHTDTHRV